MRIPPAGLLLLVFLAATAIPPGAAAGGRDVVAEQLRRHLLDSGSWAEVQIADLAIDGSPPVGSPRRIIAETGLSGRMSFTLEYGDGTTIGATATVRAFGQVLHSARALRRGQRLRENDLYPVLMEVSRIPAGAIGDPADAEGKTLTRSLGANRPLTDRMLHRTAMVKRGKRVTLLIETDGFRVAASGETRENAYVDSPVRVLNSASKKTVTGWLIDENTVRVRF